MPCFSQYRNIYTQQPPLNNVTKLDTDKRKHTLHWMPLYVLKGAAHGYCSPSGGNNSFHVVIPEECNNVRRGGHKDTHSRTQFYEELETELDEHRETVFNCSDFGLKHHNMAAISIRSVLSATQKCLFIVTASGVTFFILISRLPLCI